jgi:hypothetical protein
MMLRLSPRRCLMLANILRFYLRNAPDGALSDQALFAEALLRKVTT